MAVLRHFHPQFPAPLSGSAMMESTYLGSALLAYHHFVLVKITRRITPTKAPVMFSASGRSAFTVRVNYQRGKVLNVASFVASTHPVHREDSRQRNHWHAGSNFRHRFLAYSLRQTHNISHSSAGSALPLNVSVRWEQPGRHLYPNG